MTDLASPVWGNVSRFLLSDYGEQMPQDICHYYDYCLQYCMNWTPAVCFHPGFDVSMPYGTTVYAPAAGTITCAGTGHGVGYDGTPANPACAAYADLGPDGLGEAVGAGRVELLLDDGTVIIYGHCSQALVPYGTRVQAGDPIAASGAMNSPHLHYEVRVKNPGCGLGYAIVDPRTVPCTLFGCGIPGGDIVYLPGDKIEVNDSQGLHLRTEPTLAGGDATTITTLPMGAKLDVLSGPTVADNLHFYQVKAASPAGTGWRAIGPTTDAVWTAELRNISPGGSPMLAEAAACNAAAKEHSALALAMAWVEQKYGTFQDIIPATAHNPMSLRAGGGGWQQFASYADGIGAWYRLLTDPNGPYAGTTTVAELIHIYAPSFDGNNEEQYVNNIGIMVKRFRDQEATTPGVSPNGHDAGLTGYVAGEYTRLVNRFQVGDRIKVVDGPLNIRPQASTVGMPDGMFDAGTELCVREGPAFGEGFEWYRVEGPSHVGWVSGNFCGLAERGGCAHNGGLG